MAKPGRKPKPHMIKVLQGTAKGDGAGVPFPQAEVGSPPNWLDTPDVLEEWDRLYGLLSTTRVLTEGDLSALAHLCKLHGKTVALYRAGEFPTSSQIQQLRTYFNEFGLTPASRGRVGAVGRGKEENPFNKFRKDA